MAKIHEEVVVITVSKLIKDNESVTTFITEEIKTALEQVTQELLGDGVVVEASKA